ncbi:Inositol phosphosphingolipids phospholipase C [Wickerhamiella sorbophila]|uniref:Inositol phosphosphingolipids phospholipase C n=1 Tax=Wickerhamiella sorbophila TaxID=45607 RepID=A0A2T0FNM7_9ASCO|nr:Inositol phosphosphingolipids phospholipase C [Wickerhamiella sorbophila]PRT56588.1 Inositol phosphosphingolipids phospholipase C [Wickerhamiella sorbophila]
MLDNQVRILSLNCWGLKYISTEREARITAISERLRECSHYDIVALQELWVDRDYEHIKAAVAHFLPHTKRFYSGILAGPGLVVFSRWPIAHSSVFRFPLNGRPSAFFRGDWYVGKSVGFCIIDHPSGLKIDVFNAHLHAPYGTGDAAYTCHRTSQAWEMARLAARASETGHVVFAVGDLNSRPGTLMHQLFERTGRLSDAWVTCHGEYEGNIASLSPEDQILLAGVTSDSQLNTWRVNYAKERAKRLDYIFYDETTAAPSECKVVFTEPIPNIGSVSDHFGIEGSFVIHTPTPRQCDTDVEGSLTMFEQILMMITEYKPVAKWQASWRIWHFWLSNATVVGMMVAIWWAAKSGRAYVGFIFTTATALIMTVGVIQGLIGYLFGWAETRALKEFEDEIWMARTYLAPTKAL